jgi:hypothetical protein
MLDPGYRDVVRSAERLSMRVVEPGVEKCGAFVEMKGE